MVKERARFFIFKKQVCTANPPGGLTLKKNKLLILNVPRSNLYVSIPTCP